MNLPTIERFTSSVSFTGSETVGRTVGKAVQARFGKTLLELGGNNGMFFTEYTVRNTRC